HQALAAPYPGPSQSRPRPAPQAAPGGYLLPPHPQGRRAAAARVSGERRVWGRTGRAEGPPTPPVAFAPPATPRRTRRREGAPHRAAAWAAPTGRAAPLAWVAPTAGAAPTARAAAREGAAGPGRQAAARERAAAPNECRWPQETWRRRAGRGA